MNTADYEKAKQECWDKLFGKPIGGIKWPPISPKVAFDYGFDRAYRLGMKVAKKEQIYAESAATSQIASEESFLRDLSQNAANCDKHFDNIVKDGSRNERRLNIATQILCAIIPKFENGDIGLTISDEQDIMQVACRLADMLILEAQKGGK